MGAGSEQLSGHAGEHVDHPRGGGAGMRVSHRASEYLALFAAGFTVTEISRRCGVSKSTVSTLLKKARAPKVQRESASRTCPYSSSCFTCPMRDCVVEGTEINALVSWEEVAV